MEAVEAVTYWESPVPPSSRRPGAWRACAIGAGILLAGLFVDAVVLVACLASLEGGRDWVAIHMGPHPLLGFDRAPRAVLDNFATRATMGGPVATAWIVSAVVVVLLSLLAARSLGPSVREALGLRRPSLRQALGWAAAVAVYWLGVGLLRVLGLATDGGFAVALYRTAYSLPSSSSAASSPLRSSTRSSPAASCTRRSAALGSVCSGPSWCRRSCGRC